MNLIKISVCAATIFALLVGCEAGEAGSHEPLSRIVISESVVAYSLDNLIAESDAVALVSPTGPQREHWNNAENRHWQSNDGTPALIYRDENVRVAEAFLGSLPGEFSLRNLGGRADGYEMVLEGLYDLEADQSYLVFLEHVDTPTAEGFERAISFVGQGQGLFRLEGDRWLNSIGLEIRDTDLRNMFAAAE